MASSRSWFFLIPTCYYASDGSSEVTICTSSRGWTTYSCFSTPLSRIWLFGDCIPSTFSWKYLSAYSSSSVLYITTLTSSLRLSFTLINLPWRASFKAALSFLGLKFCSLMSETSRLYICRIVLTSSAFVRCLFVLASKRWFFFCPNPQQSK